MTKRKVSFHSALILLPIAMLVCGAAAAQSTSVDLSSSDSIYAIAQPGTAVTAGGADGLDNAYAADQLGGSVVWSGVTFNFAPPGPHSAVALKTIALPAMSDATVTLLATGVDGNQVNQTFIVTYTDGSTTRFTQSLSDWHVFQGYAGEAIAKATPYRVGPTGSEQTGVFNVYGYTLPLNAYKLPKSVTLPNNPHVIVLAINIAAPGIGTTPISTSVALSNDNVYGIGKAGTAVSGGGADGLGNAYAADKLGSSLTWQGAQFAFLPAGPGSAVANRTIALPAAKDESFSILGTGVDGNQQSQFFTITYTDGTQTTFRQSLSDWFTPQHFSGENIARAMLARVGPTGIEGSSTFNLYVYSFPLNSSKTVKTLSLPNNSHVLVLAVDVTKAGTIVAAAPTPSLPSGTYTGGQTITLSDATSGAKIYYTTDGSTPDPTNPAELYTGAFTLYATTTVKTIATHPNDANSAVTSITYTINLLNAATPTFSLPTGVYAPNPVTQQIETPPALLIQLADATPGATIRYTTDGSPPTAFSNQYFDGIVLPEGDITKINAIAYSPPGYNPSAVATATYEIPRPPSEKFGGPNNFLYNNYAEQDSCAYYQKIGAITSSASDACATNADGTYKHGITLSGWLSNSYNPYGVPESSALFVNIFDLNFTREHHAVTYKDPNESFLSSAAYVCNYPGPDFFHSTDTAAVDAAIENARNHKNPLPCVAFDYGVNVDSSGTQANHNLPFIRFLVFDNSANGSGGLMPTVDLDQRGQKSVPNACSACHGIPYGAAAPAGGYQLGPDDANGSGANYIPFDTGNFVFSSAPGWTKADQEPQIKHLNLVVLNGTGGPVTTASNSRSGIYELIHGWYDVGNLDCTTVPAPAGCPATATEQLYIPTALQASIAAVGAYADVYAPMCRSCHVANNVQSFPFPPRTPADLSSLFSSAFVCAPQPTKPTVPAVMPNSKAAFDRFWTTPFYSSYPEQGNLPYILDTFLNNTSACENYLYQNFPFP